MIKKKYSCKFRGWYASSTPIPDVSHHLQGSESLSCGDPALDELTLCTGTMANSFCSRLSSVVCLDSGPQTLWRWYQAVPQVKALLGVDRACDQEWQDLCSWALRLPEQSFSSWQVRVCLWSQYQLWGILGYEKLMKISFESFRMQGICGKFVSSLNHCSVPQSYTQCRE